MTPLEHLTFSKKVAEGELARFKQLLDAHSHGALHEREHILPFFRGHRQLAALIGVRNPDIIELDRIASEFDIFGDYKARVHNDWTAHAPCQRDARTRVRLPASDQPDAPARVRPPIRPPQTSPTRERRSGGPPTSDQPDARTRSGVAHRARMRPGRTDRTDRPSLARRAGIEPARRGRAIHSLSALNGSTQKGKRRSAAGAASYTEDAGIRPL